MTQIKLLCTISKMNWVFCDAASIEGYLQKIGMMTAQHMDASVCSIYLYDNDEQKLVLKATIGLNVDLINQVKLKIGEGICGLALKELRPICENHASKHPNYKLFSGLHEETYDALLAVPIIRGIERIGILVVQRTKGNDFTKSDISTMQAVSSQLGNIIENAKELISLKKKLPAFAEDRRFGTLKSFQQKKCRIRQSAGAGL